MSEISSLEKSILKSLYLINLGIHQIEKDKFLKENSETIKRLRDMKLVSDDYTLTDKGRKAIKVGIIGGVFDIIHVGHITLFKTAKEMVDLLIAIIATDKTVVKMKGRQPINDAESRRAVVESIKYVDAALIGDEDDFRIPLHKIKPDIIFLGYDQKIPPGISKRDLENIQVIKLNKVVEGVKTSKILDKLLNNYYKVP